LAEEVGLVAVRGLSESETSRQGAADRIWLRNRKARARVLVVVVVGGVEEEEEEEGQGAACSLMKRRDKKQPSR